MCIIKSWCFRETISVANWEGFVIVIAAMKGVKQHSLLLHLPHPVSPSLVPTIEEHNLLIVLFLQSTLLDLHPCILLFGIHKILSILLLPSLWGERDFSKVPWSGSDLLWHCPLNTEHGDGCVSTWCPCQPELVLRLDGSYLPLPNCFITHHSACEIGYQLTLWCRGIKIQTSSLSSPFMKCTPRPSA